MYIYIEYKDGVHMYTLNIKMVCACVDGGVIGVRVSDELLLLGLRRRIDFDLCFFFFFFCPRWVQGTVVLWALRLRNVVERADGVDREPDRGAVHKRHRRKARRKEPCGLEPEHRRRVAGVKNTVSIDNQIRISHQYGINQNQQSKKRQSESIENRQLADLLPSSTRTFFLSSSPMRTDSANSE
jgi:hypothetical protein